MCGVKSITSDIFIVHLLLSNCINIIIYRCVLFLCITNASRKLICPSQKPTQLGNLTGLFHYTILYSFHNILNVKWYESGLISLS